MPVHERPRLADFRDRHRGETVVVCGCGASLASLERPGRFVTIGVNDVGRLFTPDYLVVVNERRQFDAARYAHVESSRAKAVFTQLPTLELAGAPVVRFRLGRRCGTDRSDGEALHYSDNSPYVAVHLARHLGARRIGLIGVDFDDDHFFGRTGRHPLAGRVAGIDRAYAALADACGADGVELVNLSATSRLQSLPRADLETWAVRPALRVVASRSRVFCVHYRFLSCGTVFHDGLREAAATLGYASEHADWDDPGLAAKVGRFRPDLLFVVHGRRFVQRWRSLLAPGRPWRSAVWLLDEPYEVDDTAAWSGYFDCVFVDDPSTLARHRNAHYLPVAHAPASHNGSPDDARPHRVGFVGGANPTRERLLATLASQELLDYVVGGPWRDAGLGAICIADNVPAERTAALYRDTRIVVNVFRDRHHYNRDRLPATSMNPRIHEALACGALVVSEPRDEIAQVVPELPTFRDATDAVAIVRHFVEDDGDRRRVQRICASRVRDATYARRLKTAMDIALDAGPAAGAVPSRPPVPFLSAARSAHAMEDDTESDDAFAAFDDDWDNLGSVARRTRDGDVVIDPGEGRGPGAERGLAGRARFDAVDLVFEARLEPAACLVAKVHQADRIDQSSNSYHLVADERRAYLARHGHVFRQFESPRLGWVSWRLTCRDGELSIYRNHRLLHRVRDREMRSGYAFIGAQGGVVRLRGVRVAAAETTATAPRDEAEWLQPVVVPRPRLTIVTTVYDRTECLRQCIASVRRLAFRDYEHLVVADRPPPETIARIAEIVADADDPRIGLLDLPRRHNDWGIAPAAAGLRRARGEYLAFLSDDNGYTPDHVDPLIRVLDRDPTLGFVYSSCQYDGRLVLAHPVPRPGRIDLGQPMYRRELFELHLGDDLPFDMMAWDWHLVDTLMKRGVRWRHVDRPSFIFRLAKYPALMAG